MAGAVSIEAEGLKDLELALRELEPKLLLKLKGALKQAAEPVSHTATQLAKGNIRNMTEDWSKFRIGTRVALVYLAPRQRGTKIDRYKRPNFGTLLMERAMEPALSANEGIVAARADAAIGEAVKAAGF